MTLARLHAVQKLGEVDGGFFLDTPVSSSENVVRRLGHQLDADEVRVVCNWALSNEVFASCQLIFTARPPAVTKNISKK